MLTGKAEQAMTTTMVSGRPRSAVTVQLAEQKQTALASSVAVAFINQADKKTGPTENPLERWLLESGREQPWHTQFRTPDATWKPYHPTEESGFETWSLEVEVGSEQT